MIAMTTKSSIKVKPVLRPNRRLFPFISSPRHFQEPSAQIRLVEPEDQLDGLSPEAMQPATLFQSCEMPPHVFRHDFRRSPEKEPTCWIGTQPVGCRPEPLPAKGP